MARQALARRSHIQSGRDAEAGARHDPPMSAADPYARTIRQAAHDAVRALLTPPPASPEGSAALLALAGELAVDLAEALDAIAAVVQRDPVEIADRWFHDQPAPDVPGP
jgi:hypothetical protein